MDRRKLFGIIVLLNLLWAPVNFMVGTAKSGGFSAIAVGCIRWVSLAFIIQALLLFSSPFRKLIGYKPLHRHDWIRAFLLGLFFFGPSHMLFYYSLSFTSEVEGTVLLSTSPVFTGIFSYFILKEHLTTHRQLAILISSIGAYIVSVGFTLPSLAGHAKGNLLFGAGVLIECFMGVLAAKLARRSSGIGVLSAEIWGGALCFILVSLFAKGMFQIQANHVTLAGILAIGYLIFMCGLITFPLWYRIVESSPLTLLVVGIAMQPPVAALLNWVAKNELPTTNTLIGGTLILIALAIGFGIKSPHEDDVPYENDTPQELTSN